MRARTTVAGAVLTAAIAVGAPAAPAAAAGDAVTGEALLPGPVLVQADAHSGRGGERPRAGSR
jgi:hypothetical protein